MPADGGGVTMPTHALRWLAALLLVLVGGCDAVPSSELDAESTGPSVLASVELSEAEPGREGVAGPEEAAARLPDELPGFRPDARYLPDDELLGFVEVPGGPFPMGSDPAVDPMAFEEEVGAAGEGSGVRADGSATDGAAESGAEAGPGEVHVPTFYVGRYEVTVAQYAAFVEATGRSVDRRALAAPPDHPVTAVSWPDALAYARWLDRELRDWPGTPPELRERLEDGWRVTLPNEAEWEKAARGTDGRIFPWGDEAARGMANVGSDGVAPVGGFECAVCPYGLSDMSGNVWEWTRSPYQPYPFDPSDDRRQLEGDALWVMRGGSFQDPPRYVRAATRGGADPGVRNEYIGFRVVVSGE